MKSTVGRSVSTNVESPDFMSPDERQTYNNDQYAAGILRDVKAQDAPPMPRVDPRDKVSTLNGTQTTYGEFDASLAQEGAVNRYTEDLARADFMRWPLGYNDANDYKKKHGSQYEQSAQFLLETFKRAREVGYPIHPLMPYLQGQLPSTAFEGQAGQ